MLAEHGGLGPLAPVDTSDSFRFSRKPRRSAVGPENHQRQTSDRGSPLPDLGTMLARRPAAIPRRPPLTLGWLKVRHLADTTGMRTKLRHLAAVALLVWGFVTKGPSNARLKSAVGCVLALVCFAPFSLRQPHGFEKSAS